MKSIKNLRPFVSVLVIIGVLLALVFVKMEIRRLGYMIWKLEREKRSVTADMRSHQIQFARLTRPDRVEHFAQNKLELRRAEKSQVIQITGPNIVLRE